jgi:predicted 3-demethylubiquinone-9 3-methyltransferase (glyoxalase superfamily)
VSPAKNNSIFVVRSSGGGRGEFSTSPSSKNSKVKGKTHYTGEEPVGEKGAVITVDFELDGCMW